MKTYKKVLSAALACVLLCSAFAGCSKQDSKVADEITDKTMLIAYTDECAPFIYTDAATGELTGFDVELIENTFNSFKGDFKNYRFVKVDEGYVLDEDTCYTDENGVEYSAIIMCGGLQKNVGTNNKDYKWSNNIIEDKIITVTAPNSEIKSYNDLAGKRVAVASASAMAALNRNANIEGALASVTAVNGIDEALAALANGSADAVVVNSISFSTYDGSDAYTVLKGTLDVLEYAFGFAPKDDYSYGFNEAVKEMQSADYGNGDTLTPLVEKYFGSKDACVFAFATEGDK